MLYIDTETYSEIDLKVVGAWVYSHHCEVMLVSYAVDDGPAKVWDRTVDKKMPADLQHAIQHEQEICAHNSQFDRWVLNHSMHLGLKLHRWVDTMVLAYACAMPGSLEKLGVALGLDIEAAKMADGKKLVQKFCKPAAKNHKVDRYTRENAPEDWERFVEYARQDIVAMRECYKRLPTQYLMRNGEREVWLLDQAMNDRGLPIDLELVDTAIATYEKHAAELTAELQRITYNEVPTAQSNAKFLAWIKDQTGKNYRSIAKDAVDRMLTDDLPEHVRKALAIRQELGRSSVSKYQALKNAASFDGRLHGGFQFYGAKRTGRWAGRQFQPQNLPRPVIDGTDIAADALLSGHVDLFYDETTMQILSSLIRSAITAPLGRKLTVADLANIEGRVLAWLANEVWKLEAYRNGEDLYILIYSRSFGVEVSNVTKDQRQIGKVLELAMGYAGGVGAFQSMAVVYGVKVSDEKADQLKVAWREANPNIVSFWYACDRAAKKAIKFPGKVFDAGYIRFMVMNQWLMIKLPSGRFLWYLYPRIEDDNIVYQSLNETTNSWVEERTYGGKLVENITQAVARDVLAHNMPETEYHGYQIIGTVHDETITETPDDPRFSAENLCGIITTVPHWAEGLPLAAEGYESRRYRK